MPRSMVVAPRTRGIDNSSHIDARGVGLTGRQPQYPSHPLQENNGSNAVTRSTLPQ